MNRGLSVSVVCLALLELAACSSPSAPTFSAGEAQLQLAEAAPAIGTALSRRSTVQLNLTVVSGLASPGHLTLSVRDQSRVSLLASEPTAEIGARGTASLHAVFEVPADASSIQLFVAFRPAAEMVPTLVLSAGYGTE
jgi:hypothetical protein